MSNGDVPGVLWRARRCPIGCSLLEKWNCSEPGARQISRASGWRAQKWVFFNHNSLFTYLHVYVCLSVSLLCCLFACLTIYHSICVCLVCLPVFLSVCVCMCGCLFVCLCRPTYLPNCLSVCLSVHSWLNLFVCLIDLSESSRMYVCLPNYLPAVAVLHRG